MGRPKGSKNKSGDTEIEAAVSVNENDRHQFNKPADRLIAAIQIYYKQIYGEDLTFEETIDIAVEVLNARKS